jgi:hypothetical protein
MLHNRGGVLAGLGIGAGLMYLLDPTGGRRRRALVRDRLTHAARLGSDAMGATRRDVAHRASGVAARVRGALRREAVDDQVLVERVRARLGRFVSHPHAIEVAADHGVVTVRGPILRAEAQQLLNAVGEVRGVQDVVSALTVHDDGAVPALQGGRTPAAWRSDLRQRRWSPATRLMASTAGAALTGYGTSRRDVPGVLLAAAGLGLLARSATNRARRS